MIEAGPSFCIASSTTNVGGVGYSSSSFCLLFLVSTLGQSFSKDETQLNTWSRSSKFSWTSWQSLISSRNVDSTWSETYRQLVLLTQFQLTVSSGILDQEEPQAVADVYCCLHLALAPSPQLHKILVTLPVGTWSPLSVIHLWPPLSCLHTVTKSLVFTIGIQLIHYKIWGGFYHEICIIGQKVKLYLKTGPFLNPTRGYRKKVSSTVRVTVLARHSHDSSPKRIVQLSWLHLGLLEIPISLLIGAKLTK